MTRISVVGLGKLGQSLAACFAVRGFETIGVDVDEHVVDSINRGVPSIVEPSLQELINTAGSRLRATLSHEEAITESDVTFVLVATPSNGDGSFSNRYVEASLKSLAIAFGENGKPYHVFVVSSTVLPGSTAGSFIPIIEKYSGRKLNADFGVCYNPDFVALGEVIEGFLFPELVLIGESSKEAGDKVEVIHRQMCKIEPHIARMSIVSAEIAKVSLNTYITMKISYANTLANICEKIPNADIDAITKAVGVDKRVSPFYFRGGLSFGGTCFPRDTKAFMAIAKQCGNDAELIKAVEKVNAFQDQHLVAVVRSHISSLRDRTVGILGLSFKPDTPVITESPAIRLIETLLEDNLRIVVYDPLAIENTRTLFKDSIEYVSSAEECLAQSSLCVITQCSDEFKSAVESYSPDGPMKIVDCWRDIDPSKLDGRVECIALGRAIHYPDDARAERTLP